MKIYIKYDNPKYKLKSYGNWIDLRSSENVKIKKGGNKLIKLGVAMKLPKYFQANIVSRSGTYNNFNVIMANSYGVIDGPDNKSQGYSGNNDVWMFNAVALKNDVVVNEGDRICQFEVRLSMNAPWYIKLRWLFSNGFKFIEVDELESENRGGFGKSGIK